MAKGTWESAAPRACGVLVGSIAWQFNAVITEDTFFKPICEYTPAFGSWMVCISDVLSVKGKQLQDATTSVNKLCEQYKSFNPSDLVQAYTNATEYLPYLLKNNGTQNSPVRVDSTAALQLSSGWFHFLRNYDISDFFSRALLYYMLSVVLLTIFFQSAAVRRFLDGNYYMKRCLNKIKGKALLPTLNGKHAQPVDANSYFFRSLIPCSGEFVILLGFLVLHTVGVAGFYSIDPNNSLFPSTTFQYLRYVGDRTGIMCMAEIVLVIMLCSRNSMLERFCGWKFSTSIMLHKWLGRICILDAAVHSVAYRVMVQLNNTKDFEMAQSYWTWGVVAMVTASVLFGLSVGSVRALFYEIFLTGHVLLSVVFLISSFKHVKKFGYTNWLIGSALDWFTEHIFRLWKMMRFSRKRVAARCELISSPDAGNDPHNNTLIRLSIPKPAQFKLIPGQYVFLYLQIPWKPWFWWQSHPFTVVEQRIPENASTDQELIAVIQPKNGITHALFNHTKTHSHIPLLVEGPYGPVSSCSGYDLLIAGGSGIPGPLSHALYQSKEATLMVICRGLNVLEAWHQQLLGLRMASVKLVVYVTGQVHEEENDGSSTIVHELSQFATIHYGRPNISAFLKESLLGFPQNISIACCGPPAVVDMTRDTVAELVTADPSRNIKYTEEYQIW